MKIALVGDYSATVLAHRAIPQALDLAARSVGCDVAPQWIATTELANDADKRLETFGGVWVVPNSPYASMDGVLNAIRFAREKGIPFLGTCGGFQHALIEYARNVLRIPAADHEESNPAGSLLLVSRLSCSLAESTGTVRILPGTRLAEIYGANETVEQFNCNFGLNPHHASLFQNGALRVSACDARGEVRAVEMQGHPFFIATLFQPERSALSGVVHPLIETFVKMVAKR